MQGMWLDVSKAAAFMSEPTIPTPPPYGTLLWEHMNDDHGLLLIASELDEIRRICRKLDEEDAVLAFVRQSELMRSSQGHSA